MKRLVGYREDSILEFARKMDGDGTYRNVTNTQVYATFYKLLSENRDDIEVYSSEIVSVMMFLTFVYRGNRPSASGLSCEDLAKKIIIPNFNRGLYNQKQMIDIVRRVDKEQYITILGAKEVSIDKFEKAICLIMILVGKDLDELLLDFKSTNKILSFSKNIKKTFLGIEDIKNAI